MEDAAVSTPHSKTWTFFEGEWREGNTPIMGVRSHGAWMGSTVFDGARYFEGVMPDVDLHMARINQSAKNFLLEAKVSVERWLELTREGIAKFDRDAELYIRPMYWAELALPGGGVKYDPASTRYALCIYEAPMLKPGAASSSVTLSPFRRPSIEYAPVDAKAGCLYPNGARALVEAASRGFDNCLMRDAMGAVAELANANVAFAKDGVMYTPAPNGSFLNGITRQRVIGLLREAGVKVVEKTLRYEEFYDADEIFSCGNYNKVVPITRIDDRDLQPGPVMRKARELYWDYAHGRATSAAA
ncbi:MAG TPA: branched-chain amino acid aminotransferase [Caulobacteraceae bacterium]|jgi:branched-chain amino acid aminotransferase